MMNDSRPNLFEIATSELSQDAFIAWLLEWAQPKHKKGDEKLHDCAVSFVGALLEMASDKVNNFKVDNIEVKKQWKKIDVTAMVNDKFFIVIEDKKSTGEHSDQLERYKTIAKEEYKNNENEIVTVPIFFKMEEEGEIGKIKGKGYEWFTRERMLAVLTPYIISTKNTTNAIALDFYRYLKNLDAKINSFKTLPIDEWHGLSWQGFFAALIHRVLDEGKFLRVENAAGGFLGLYWNCKDKSFQGKYYEFVLSFNENFFEIRLHHVEEKNRWILRDIYRKKIFQLAQTSGLAFNSFGRFGRTMGVVRLTNEYRIADENKILQFDRTVEKIKELEAFSNEIVKMVDEEYEK